MRIALDHTERRREVVMKGISAYSGYLIIKLNFPEGIMLYPKTFLCDFFSKILLF